MEQIVKITRNKKVNFGRYSIRGVPLFAIRDRYRGGDSIEELAYDYDLTEAEIKAALNFRSKKLIL